MRLPKHRLQRKRDSIRTWGKSLPCMKILRKYMYEYPRVGVYTYTNTEVWLYTCLYLCVQQMLVLCQVLC